MDDQDKQLKPETLVPELVNETAEVNSNPKGAGRKSIEDDPELQKEYETIYALKLITDNNFQVARALKISVGKVKNAVTWMRKHAEIPNSEEFKKDYRARIAERRYKLKQMASNEEQNGQIICYPNGEPILKADGSPYKKYDKYFVLRIQQELREQDKLEMAIEITAPANIQQNNVIIGDVIMNKNVLEVANALNNGIAPEDRLVILGVMKKYGKPPSED